MITRRGSQAASNYLFLLCFFTNSSFLYQLDGLLESRGFELNRRSISQSISQNAERDIGKACGLISNRDRQEDIDPEFARLYGPYLLTLG